MKHRILLRFCIATLALSVALALTSTLLARASGTSNPLSALIADIPFWSVDGGGGSSTGGSYTVIGDIGQADAGTLSGGAYSLDGGFLGGAPASRFVFLPSIQR